MARARDTGFGEVMPAHAARGPGTRCAADSHASVRVSSGALAGTAWQRTIAENDGYSGIIPVLMSGGPVRRRRGRLIWARAQAAASWPA